MSNANSARIAALAALFILIVSVNSYSQSKPTGQWKITENTDEMTGKKSSIVSVTSEDGKYGLIVYRKAKDEFVIGIQLLGRGLIEDDKRPLLRFDEAEAFEQSWTVFQRGKGAAFVLTSDKLMPKLLAASVLRLRFEEYLGGLTTIKFEVQGLKAALDSLDPRPH
jgi:invasion protein IalB